MMLCSRCWARWLSDGRSLGQYGAVSFGCWINPCSCAGDGLLLIGGLFSLAARWLAGFRHNILRHPSQNRPASYTINPSSGLALGNWRYERTYSKSELGITTLTDKKFSCGVFLAEDGPQQIDVIVNMLDSEGNILYTTSGTGISIERAQVLEATGPLFSLSTQSSLSFDTSTDLIQITLQ